MGGLRRTGYRRNIEYNGVYRAMGQSSGVSSYYDGTGRRPFYYLTGLVCATVRQVDRPSACDIRVTTSTSVEAHGALRSFEIDGPSL